MSCLADFGCEDHPPRDEDHAKRLTSRNKGREMLATQPSHTTPATRGAPQAQGPRRSPDAETHLCIHSAHDLDGHPCENVITAHGLDAPAALEQPIEFE